jgi:spore maturation protein SpmA
MLNGVFVALVLSSVAIGALFGTMEGVADAAVESAVGAAKLALGLLGQMTLWLGLVRILQEAGLMAALARALSPVMRPLFPALPPGDPAFGAILLNLSANALGLTNAATPFGLKAMKELQRLQERPGVASDAMIVFVTLTASGVAVLPLGMIAVRSTMGAELPGAIILPSMGATLCSTLV